MASNNVNKIYRSDKYTPELLALVQELLSYDPLTGRITWKIARSRRIKAGDEAGSKSKSKNKQLGGYRTFGVREAGKDWLIPAHRAAWALYYGHWPKQEIDHINGIKDDNRISNLREATTKENLKNQSKYKNNTSGVTGVYWNARDQRWTPLIGVSSRLVHLGYFDDFFEAVCARKSAELKYGFHPNHGRDAST